MRSHMLAVLFANRASYRYRIDRNMKSPPSIVVTVLPHENDQNSLRIRARPIPAMIRINVRTRTLKGRLMIPNKASENPVRIIPSSTPSKANMAAMVNANKNGNRNLRGRKAYNRKPPAATLNIRISWRLSSRCKK